MSLSQVPVLPEDEGSEFARSKATTCFELIFRLFSKIIIIRTHPNFIKDHIILILFLIFSLRLLFGVHDLYKQLFHVFILSLTTSAIISG